MLGENVRKLAHFRLSQADDAVRAAHLLLDQGLLRDAVNRSYYGMFYAVLALLVTKKSGTSKHRGAIMLFDREFIRTGIFDREMSYWLHEAFEVRLDADYAELADLPQEDAQRILEHAEIFISRVKAYLALLLAEPSEANGSEGPQ